MEEDRERVADHSPGGPGNAPCFEEDRDRIADHSPTGPGAPTISVVGPDRPKMLPRIQTDGLTQLPPNAADPSSPQPEDPPGTSLESANGRAPSTSHLSSQSHRKNESLGQNLLAVPGTRSRGSSIESNDSPSPSSYAGDTDVPSSGMSAEEGRKSQNNPSVINDEGALKPDPQTEAEFLVDHNKFAFSPGQLNKLINPKSLAAFYALGGLAGLEKGLRTDRQSGLSTEEVGLDGTVSFDEAVQVAKADHNTKSLRRSQSSSTTSAPPDASDGAFFDRKRVFRDNRLPQKKSKSIWQLAWIAYNDKVLMLLTAAAVISLAVGVFQSVQSQREDGKAGIEWVEGVAIIVAVLIVVIVGAANDWQKERQFIRLNRKKEERFVKIVRSGKSQEISVYDVLVGDVMHLEPGDLIPVDGIFIDGHNVKCDESSATGESDLLKKAPAAQAYRAIENHEPLRKVDPFILSGGKVSEGVGTFLVTSVGIYSSYGKTMMSLQDEGQTTPLQSKLNVLATYIAKLGLAAGLILFVVLFIRFLIGLNSITGGPDAKGQAFLQIFIVAVTIVVVAVPEGLPLAVTLALAFATTRMLRDNNLVRVLRACETMGNATTICSDKTGTLTQNKMSVVAGTLGTSSRFADTQSVTLEPEIPSGKMAEIATAGNAVPSSEFTATLSAEVKEAVKDSIVLNSTAFEAEEGGKTVFVGSKTETALLEFAKDHFGLASVSQERANAKTVQMVPFDSGRKCMAVVIKKSDGRYRLFVKGASEILIARCSKIVQDPASGMGESMLTGENMETLQEIIKSYASRSLRTIAFLYRDYEQWPPRGAPVQQDDAQMVDFDQVFKDMVFLGIVGIQDPLRPGVAESVRQCQIAGVFVRMVTGDNLMTAKAIASECGIFTAGGIAMEGPVFRKLSSKQVRQIIPRLQVLARSSPEDKSKLVKHLRKAGETVAVTGDGTNDAPALKAADVGFSMGIAGTEVAKEASAIILMDDNFNSIVKAVAWGRTVNDAVKKFLQFQITVNITAVLLTFISAVASEEEEDKSVLTAVQLLWVNLIMDTLAALALATDPPTPSLLRRKPEPKSAPLITFTMWKMIIGQAIFQLIVTLILNFQGLAIFGYAEDRREQMRTLIFNTFVFMQIFNQWNARRLDNKFNIFEGVQRNYWFIGIQFIIIGGQALIINVGGAAFHVVPLEGDQWGYSVALGLLSLPVAIIIRLIPDDLVRKVISFIPRRQSKTTPLLTVEDDDRFQDWNPALDDIREELSFLKKIRGGRMSELTYKLQNAKETLKSRSRSGSVSRTDNSVPQTPQGDNATSPPTTASGTPEKSRARGRSRSGSHFGPAAAMAGIIAGSVAGGWSPIERGPEDSEPIKFSTSGLHGGLSNTEGVEVHPDTRSDDPVIVENPQHSRLPPSQNPALTPHFAHTSDHVEPSSSSSEQASSEPPPKLAGS